MQQNRLFDDFARLMTDAAGAAQGVRREAETMVKAQIERMLRDMDVATREEVEVLRDLVASLRAQNDALAARVAALEAKPTETKPAETKPADVKSAESKPASKPKGAGTGGTATA
ncbi:pyrroline-5-carboxylate reductase [Methylobacterium variabile]|jgi:BMFP domain-containing protein YqiC|uniref:Pyrroline-5-carboxylate reductase n=1 Tax=Methylobacterium variabile TaxID=298794 RepID=A0A0J6SPK5_9HYPH|nr:accessory factor UbiK family protein [Methylobacterium variabile]KMO35599.1 pyrroline-5-carboxylate reductase [Methylobacterium variabile]